MHFIATTSSNGVTERTFTLAEHTGVLWTPVRATPGAPLLLAAHGGGMHKKAPGLVATALHCVGRYGFAVAAIDAPGHGDRPRNDRDDRWVDAIRRARAAGEPIAAVAADYSMSLAERAVPEWQATIDALQTLPEIGVDAPIGFGGVSLGVATGVMLAVNEARIGAASFGAALVHDALLDAARHISVPVECRIPWDDPVYDRASGIELFDALGSAEKTLSAYCGRYPVLPDHVRDDSARFFARTLRRRTGDAGAL
jgi:pimeloyl-ACP methyl ester carboxylesterase